MMDDMGPAGERELWSQTSPGGWVARDVYLFALSCFVPLDLFLLTSSITVAAPVTALVVLAHLIWAALAIRSWWRHYRTVVRMWTDPARPGIVWLRRADDTVESLVPDRIRQIRVVHTTGWFQGENPQSYRLTRVSLQAGLASYPLGELDSWPATRKALERTFPGARLNERTIHRSSRESAD